jgi:hypothetical protein
MEKRRSSHQTQWAAQFAVASELCKRGCQVALTMGNHPITDLMVISPQGKSLQIDVKGLYKKNFWGVRGRPAQNDLYYVFAYVPDNQANRFYVLTRAQVNAEIRKAIETARKRALEKGKSGDNADKFPGVSWKFVQPWENKWENMLPA